MRGLTELNDRERRVVGALMEKEQATPEYYPLTLKALVAACNQKSNRDPVFTMAEIDVLNTLRVLQQENLVERVSGARVDRWEHKVDPVVRFKPELKAVLTLLMLRGAQTPGELRARAERLHPFDTIQAVEEALHGLGELNPPLVRLLPRRPGQKESRWWLARAGEESEPERVRSAASSGADGAVETTSARLARLEQQVADLADQVLELQERLDSTS